MREIKIVHVINSLGGGGLERRMLECVKGLGLDKQYSQHVILLYDIIDYPDIYDTNADVVRLSSRSKLNKGNELIKIISKIEPDIVHLWTCSLITLPVYLCKQSLGYKIIAGFIADGNPINSPVYKFALRYFSKKADKIVSNSKAGIIAKRAPEEKSVVIYNGFSFDRFKNFPTYDKETIKKEIGVTTKFIVSMNARFYPAKDWKTFLEIVKKVEDVRQDVIFLAVGQGNQLRHYKNVAEGMGLKNLIFTGFRKDIDKIYFISDVCVLCTNEKVHAEGVSNAIMEAMAAGKPVIATMGGGTPEIIENGHNGIIICPHDSDEGAKVILRFVSDDSYRLSLGNFAMETIKQRFTLSSMGDRYKIIYQSLLELDM